MSHQNRKFKEGIVVNHESIKQAVNWLFTAKGCRTGFATESGVVRQRGGSLQDAAWKVGKTCNAIAVSAHTRIHARSAMRSGFFKNIGVTANGPFR